MSFQRELKNAIAFTLKKKRIPKAPLLLMFSKSLLNIDKHINDSGSQSQRNLFQAKNSQENDQ